MSFDELDEREQAERPADAVAVAELVEGIGRMIEPIVGHAHVAGEERDPCSMLFEPGQAALIVEQAVQGVGLAEEPLGIGQGSAEELDETTGAQGTSETIGSIDRAQQVDCRAELDASVDEPAPGVMHASRADDGRRLERQRRRVATRWPDALSRSARAASKSRRSSRAPARMSCSWTRFSSCSRPGGSSSRARPAWRDGDAKAAVVVGAFGGGLEQLALLRRGSWWRRPSTGPSSFTSSAAVASVVGTIIETRLGSWPSPWRRRRDAGRERPW